MKTGSFLFAIAGPILMQARPAAPADLAPPPGWIVALPLGVLIVCGLFTVAVVGISILVIRAIKKSGTPQDKT
jgi:hypothetical protein